MMIRATSKWGERSVDLRLPEPEASGFADVAGVQIAWESFGQGESAVLVVPTWNFVDSRVSAPLVPDLSRSFRVVTFDPRGAGRSDRPRTGYRLDDHVADAVAVLQAAGVARASLVAGSSGANTAVLLAARLPDQVERLILIAPAISVGPAARSQDDKDDFWIERASYEGWLRWSAPYWRQDWPGFARWFLETAFNESGSEALIDAVLQIALEADPEMLIQQHREMHRGLDFLAAPAILGTISSPTLVLHGALDLSLPLAVAEAVAAAIPGAALAVALAGGHRPDIRSPELINPLLVEFLRGQQLTARPGIEIRQ
jgi:pimeloyl-ACP methyl ester carboxylesterase